MHCALAVALTFVGLAAAYLQLNAQFVGLAQVLVYVGAVAILIVFAVLLTRGGEPLGERHRSGRQLDRNRAERIRRVVGSGPTYISFDVDGLDPVYAPGTGTPEIGGITTREAQQVLRGLQGVNLVGGDVVEVSPPFDPSGNTALVGATMMFEIMCILADAVARRRKRAAR